MNEPSFSDSKKLFYNSISHYDSVALRFIICGSVDNGKSTLLGRLLYESGAIFRDQMRSLKKRNIDNVYDDILLDETIDYSYVLDGLQDERLQNITIDVAHRYFRTNNRNFILLDTPGHDQYLKNMAVAASQSDIAILVIDATEGLTHATARHAYILFLMGIKSFIVCVNKIDMIEYNLKLYEKMRESINLQFEKIGKINIQYIPVSAINGDNIISNSLRTPWYSGQSLLKIMEGIELSNQESNDMFYMPVQYVLKNLSKKFRGYSGLPGPAIISVGEKITILPAGHSCAIKKIYDGDQQVISSSPNRVLVLETKETMDITRGDLVVSSNFVVKNARQFSVKILWFDSQEPLLKGRKYLFKHTHNLILGYVSKIKGVLELNSMQAILGDQLVNNDIGFCNINLEKDIFFLNYSQSSYLGSLLIIDRNTFETVGIVILEHELDKSNNIKMQQNCNVGKSDRSLMKKQKPFVIWLTGLSGAGKSTLANLLEKKLFVSGYHTYLIDGDNIRCGLNEDLGFKKTDRIENLRRITEVVNLFLDAGLITIVATISPFKIERDDAKKKFGPDEFIEVFMDASLETCISRDPKGLYAKQAKGEARNFTGIDSPYEIPENPDVHLDSNHNSAVQLIQKLIDYLYKNRFIDKEI